MSRLALLDEWQMTVPLKKDIKDCVSKFSSYNIILLERTNMSFGCRIWSCTRNCLVIDGWGEPNVCCSLLFWDCIKSWKNVNTANSTIINNLLWSFTCRLPRLRDCRIALILRGETASALNIPNFIQMELMIYSYLVPVPLLDHLHLPVLYC